MKRLVAVVLVTLLLFSLTACGGNTTTAENEPPASDAGQVEPEQTGQETDSAQAGDGKGVLCENYRSYKNARDDFQGYVLEQSENHEIVSTKVSMVTAFDLKIFNYVLPLEFLGESFSVYGKHDKDMETMMLQTAWAKDADLTYNGAGSYNLKGTDTDGSALGIRAMYDDASDSLRMEGYKNGELVVVFEYVKTTGGYAAQYYFETVSGFDKATPITEFCTYRTIFDGNDGSCARFDGMDSEPSTIFCVVPEAASFIDGATHWFTVSNGEFTGNLGGTGF